MSASKRIRPSTSRFGSAWKRIIERCRQERVDAAEQLKLFQQLRQDIEGEQRTAQDIGLSARGFAIYGLLEAGRPGRVCRGGGAVRLA